MRLFSLLAKEGEGEVEAFDFAEPALVGGAASAGDGIEAAQLSTRPPQLGPGRQPQVGLGAFVAHPLSVHHAAERDGPPGGHALAEPRAAV